MCNNIDNIIYKKTKDIRIKKAFTLFEIVLALIIFSMLIGIIFSVYINIKKSEWKIKIQQILVQESNNFLDRLYRLSLDYTIDYEEYFNRAQSSCLTWSTAIRNTWWVCDVFTKYGNVSSDGWLYYCNSNQNFTQSWYNSYLFSFDAWNPVWCKQSWNQSFWQYKRQFRDTVDEYLNNWNDVFVGKWPIAILQNTWVQELYLINNDWNHRIFFRRKFITWIDLNWDWFITGKNESLYKIQVLKLKGFDAWLNHDFDLSLSNWWAYDWFIDTRACDTDAWFVCNGLSVWDSEYSWYHLPLDNDDWRVDITDPRITVSDRNFKIYPAKDPYLATNEPKYLVDPFIQINITLNSYWDMKDDEIILQTSLWFKNSHSNFELLDLSNY